MLLKKPRLARLGSPFIPFVRVGHGFQRREKGGLYRQGEVELNQRGLR